MSELKKWIDLVAGTESMIEYSDSKGFSKVTFHELYQNAIRIGDWSLLTSKNSKAVCVLFLDKNIDLMFSFLISLLNNYIPLMLPYYSSRREVLEVAEFLEAETIIVSSTFLPCLKGTNRYQLLCSWKSPTQMVYCFTRKQRMRNISPHPLTEVMFLSSGSTGKPKIIQLSGTNVISNLMAIQEYIRLVNQDRVLVTRSLSTASVLVGEVLPALSSRSTVHFCDSRASLLTINEYIVKYRPTFLCTVPAALFPLTTNNNMIPPELKKIVTVGAAASPAMLVSMAQNYPKIELYPSYGLTEASPRVAYLHPDMLMRKIGSAGIPVQDVQVKICSPCGETVEDEDIGEVMVKGSNVMLGYYGESMSFIRDRRLLTGHMGYKDKKKNNEGEVNVGCPLFIERVFCVFTRERQLDAIGHSGVVCSYMKVSVINIGLYTSFFAICSIFSPTNENL